MAVGSTTTYSCGLAEFVDNTISNWARQKKEVLEPKLKRNFNAVTNADFRAKTWKKGEAKGWRSDSWIGFVRVKIWAFYSTMLDTVLKAGKIPFDLEADEDDADDLDEFALQDQEQRIERMTNKIESQLGLRKADREYMKKWLSGGYYGIAISKFTVEPVKNLRFRKVDVGMGDIAQYLTPEESAQYTRYEPFEDVQDVPGHRYVSVWNMVWDMEAEDLQSGAGYAEMIRSSPYDLRQLKGKGAGYIDEAIDRVIESVRGRDSVDQSDTLETPALLNLQHRRNTILRREFYMRAPRALVEDFEEILKTNHRTVAYSINEYADAEDSGDDIEIMGEIADKEIIRFIRNDGGKRPHYLWVVERNLDESIGNGIADNMESVQSSLIGMIRSFEDNKKLSANVTVAIKELYFNKPEQLNDVVPGKKYSISDACDDVRKAIFPIVYPDVGESLMSGISLMLQLKDDVSMIPTITQGFTLPKHQPDTAYEMRQLTENAGKYIGQAIRNNDEMFIEPEITDIYEYNMLGDDESCKVACRVRPNGFTSFQSKEIRGERMKQALALFISSEILLPYIKIKPHLDIIYESMDEDPEKFLKSEQEMQEEDMREQEAMAMQAQQAQQQAAIQSQQAKAEQDMSKRADMDKAEQKHVHELEKEVIKANLK